MRHDRICYCLKRHSANSARGEKCTHKILNSRTDDAAASMMLLNSRGRLAHVRLSPNTRRTNMINCYCIYQFSPFLCAYKLRVILYESCIVILQRICRGKTVVISASCVFSKMGFLRFLNIFKRVKRLIVGS